MNAPFQNGIKKEGAFYMVKMPRFETSCLETWVKTLVTEIIFLTSFIAVWGAAMGIIFMNESYLMVDFKNWAFEKSTGSAIYITTLTMFWINSRYAFDFILLKPILNGLLWILAS